MNNESLVEQAARTSAALAPHIEQETKIELALQASEAARCGCKPGKQLITIGKDGSVTSLDFKNKGFDIAVLGPAKKQRSTDIKWDEKAQLWYVHFLTGKRASTNLTSNDLPMEGEPLDMPGITSISLGGETFETPLGTLLFKEYELAVKAEVLIIQHWRSTGRNEEVL